MNNSRVSKVISNLEGYLKILYFASILKLCNLANNWVYAYFVKVPIKKALSERGLVIKTAAENAWYVILCLCFGAGYFQKVIIKKALSEVNVSWVSHFVSEKSSDLLIKR